MGQEKSFFSIVLCLCFYQVQGGIVEHVGHNKDRKQKVWDKIVALKLHHKLDSLKWLKMQISGLQFQEWDQIICISNKFLVMPGQLMLLVWEHNWRTVSIE